MVATVTTAVVLVSPQPAGGPPANGSNGSNGHSLAGGKLAPFALVANRPLLLHVIDSLEAAGIESILFAADARLAPMVESVTEGVEGQGPELRMTTFDQLTLAGALAEARSIYGPVHVLVQFADSLGRDLDQHLRAAGANDHDALLLVSEREAQNGTVHHLNGHLAALPGLAPGAGHWSPAGLAVLGPAAAECAGALPASATHDMELVALARRMADGGGRLEARWADDWFRMRGNPSGLLEANRFALQGLRRDVPAGSLEGESDVQGAVEIHPTARLESAVVRGPAVIGAGAHLMNAYVGPYSAIGDNVIIDGAEVEHSIILSGSRVTHLGERLEGSVIGPNAHVFRDFRLPRALRLNVGEGAEVSVH